MMSMVKRDALESALREAGYEAVTFKDKVIFERVGTGIGEVDVVDVIAAPAKSEATLIEFDGNERNYAALKVAQEVGLQYRELQEYGGAVILRDCRIDNGGASPAPAEPKPREPEDDAKEVEVIQ